MTRRYHEAGERSKLGCRWIEDDRVGGTNPSTKESVRVRSSAQARFLQRRTYFHLGRGEDCLVKILSICRHEVKHATRPCPHSGDVARSFVAKSRFHQASLPRVSDVLEAEGFPVTKRVSREHAFTRDPVDSGVGSPIRLTWELAIQADLGSASAANDPRSRRSSEWRTRCSG